MFGCLGRKPFVSGRPGKTLIAVGLSGAVLFASAIAGPVPMASAHVKISRPASWSDVTGPTRVPFGSAALGVVPPANPSQSLPPSPNFTNNGSCVSGVLDNSQTCANAALQAIDNARSVLESMSSMSLNMKAFEAMTVPQQLFVVTNLERVDRGLSPITGLTMQLDNVAQTGANNSTDPILSSSTLTGGAPVSSWGSLWGGGTANPLGTDYYWMYDDGYNSPNASCTTATPQACWGHRDQILRSFSSCNGSTAFEQYMGAAFNPNSSSPGPSFTEILVGACGPVPTDVVFTWIQAEQLLDAPAASTVTGVAPATGPGAGGTSVTITGTNFTGATAVTFGATPAASYTVTGATSITAISPAHALGTVDVTVTAPGGTSVAGPADQFTFAAPDFSLSVAPSSEAVPPGSAASFSISLDAVSGDTSPVTLSVTGAPSGTTFSANPPAWSASTASSTMTVPASAPTGSYAMTITGTDTAGRTHSASATLTVASALTGTANIIGSVYSAGVAVSGANISVLQNGAIVTSTTTGSSGAFTITGLTQGTYTLVVTAAGYIGTSVPVSVFNGNWTRIGVALTRSSSPAATTVTGVAPATGPGAGGTSVTITGTNFTGATAVTFGATPAASYTVTGATSITAISPAHALGTVDVTVTAPGGTSVAGAAGQFTFAAPDFSLSVAPSSEAVPPGSAASFSISLDAVSGDTSPVTLSVTGAPSGTTFSANPPAWSASTASSTMTVPASAPTGSYAMTITGTDTAGRTHSASATLTVASALTGTANIIGSVYSAGVFVSGANVSVLQNGAIVTSTTTGSSGAFTITGLTQGTYTLVVTAAGYIGTSVPVSVFNGNWTRIGVALTH